MVQWLKMAVMTAAMGVMTAGPVLAGEQLLGTAAVVVHPQRETLSVGGQQGTFKALRMEVRQSDVEVLDLKVIYGNGMIDDIPVRQTFKANSSSRVIDLKGKDRAIKEIVVTYVPYGPAKILFYGVEGAPPAQWVQLGCKGVAFLVDHDSVQVGHKDGTFTRIRLRVKEAPVEFFSIRVTFGNGYRQDIKAHEIVRAGSISRPIDLIGDKRGIDHIDLLYRSIPTFKGKAEVCIDGLQQ